MRLVILALFLATIAPILPASSAMADQTAPAPIPTLRTCAGEAFIPAKAGRVFCEQHFAAQGACTGTEQLPIVANPWEPSAISIRGVTIAFEATGISVGHVYAGNSYNHDVMAWLDPAREGVVRQWFPDGLSFQFPGIEQETENDRSRVDLHAYCLPIGTPFSAYLIVYYTIP